MKSTEELVAESNRIEAIYRWPTDAEVKAFDDFLNLEEVKIADLCGFVATNQRGAVLRDRSGLNVSVGPHMPPPGGQAIVYKLQDILDQVNKGGSKEAWDVHCQYETLHPFTDGNGRSGRMLWHYMMDRDTRAGRQYGFLHYFYYQTLQNYRKAT